MTLTVVADFGSSIEARDAIDKLMAAGVSRNQIETYPTLDAKVPVVDSESTPVSGSETRLSPDGPLGHLGTILAKVFNVGKPDENVQSKLEPTRESTGSDYVFLAVDISGIESKSTQLQMLLRDAGAGRVEEHQS